MTDIGKIGFSADTSQLTALEAELAKVEARIQSVAAEINRLNASGDTGSQAMRKLQDEWSALGQKSSDLQGQIQKVGDAITTSSTKAQEASSKFSSLGDSADDMGKSLKSAGDNAGAIGDKVKDSAAKIDDAKSKFVGLGSSAEGTGGKFKDAGSAIGDSAGSMDKAGEAAKRVGSTLDQSLVPAVQKAQGFWKSFVDGFKQGFGDAVNETKQLEAPIAKAGQVTQQLDEYVRRTGVSYATAAEAIKKTSAVQEEFNTTTTKSGGILSSLMNLFTGYGRTTQSVSAAVKDHAQNTRTLSDEHTRGTSTFNLFNAAVRTTAPALAEAGIQMNSMTRLTGAARVGIGALALAIGGELVVMLARMGEEADIARQRLQGLAGVRIGNQLANEFDAANQQIGHLPGSIAPAIEALVRYQQLHGPENLVPPSLTGGFESLGIKAKDVTDSVFHLFESLRLGGAEATPALQGVIKFYEDAAREGKVTAQMFSELQRLSPETATMFANVFTKGKQSATEFNETLKQQPVTVESFLRVLRAAGPELDRAYQSMIDNPQRFGDAITKFQTKWDELRRNVNNANGWDAKGPAVATQMLSQFADDIGKVAKGFKDGGAVGEANNFFEGIGRAARKGNDSIAEAFNVTKQAMADFERGVRDGGNIAEGDSVFNRLGRAAKQMATDISDAIDTGKKAYAEFKQGISEGQAGKGFDSDATAAQNLGRALGLVVKDFTDFKKGLSEAGTAADSNTTTFQNLGRMAGTVGKDFSDFSKGLGETDVKLNESAPFFEKLGRAAGQTGIAIKDFAIALGGGLIDALAAIGNFVSNAIEKLTKWANDAIGLARSVGAAIAAAVANQNSSPMPMGNPMDNPGGGGSVAEQAQVQSSGGGGGFDYASAVADGTYPAFATGGSFIVGGSGGTDSQLIQFMATPGERVTVDPPNTASAGGGAAAQTLGSLLPVANDNAPFSVGSPGADVLSAHFAESLRDQTASINDKAGLVKDAIIAAVNAAANAIGNAIKTYGAGTATASSTVASTGTSSAGTSTSSASSLGSASSASSGGGGGGGGGFNTKKSDDGEFGSPWSLHDEPKGAKSSQQDVPARPMTPAEALAAAGMIGGQAGTVKGFKGSFPVTDANNNPISNSGTTNKTPQSIAGPTGPIDQTGRPLGSPSTSGMPLPETSTIRQFGPGGMKESVVPKEAQQAVEKQTDTLKTAGTQNSKTVADAVDEGATSAKTIGDKANTSLDGVEAATKNSLKSIDSVGDATEAGNQVSRSGFSETNSALGDVETASNQTNQSVGQTTEAVSSGSGNIVSSVQSAASEISNAVASAVSSAASHSNSSGSSGGGSKSGGSSSGGDGSGFDNGSFGDSGSSYDDGSSPTSGFGGGDSGGFQGSDSFGGGFGGWGSGSDSGAFNGGFDTGSIDYGGGSSDAGYFATGGQFTVGGPGHTDTEKVEFWASPGEVITITPPSGTPPPNPSFGSSPMTKSGTRAFALGGQLTLGGLFGTPTVSKNSVDLISAHITESLHDQSASLGAKIDGMGSQIVEASDASTSRIMSAIGSVSSAIPNAEATAGSTATPTASASSDAPKYDAATIAAAVAQRYAAMAQGGQAAAPTAAPSLARSSGLPRGFAIGGQFTVGRGGLPSFATGGQMTIDDSTGMNLGGGSIGADVVSSTLDRKTDSQTASIKGKIDSTTSKVVSAITGSGNRIAAGVSAIKDRFDAWRTSVSISSKTSESSSGSGGGVAPSDSFGRFGLNNMSVGSPLWNYMNLSPQMLTFNNAPGAKQIGYQDIIDGYGGGVTYKGYGGGSSAQNLLTTQPPGTFYSASPFGGMADGGTFIVPGGTSGTDSVNVAIKAAPGERIVVMQPKEAEEFKNLTNTIRVTPEPLSKFIPKPAPLVADNDDAPSPAASAYQMRARLLGMVPGAAMAGPWRDSAPIAGLPVAASNSDGTGAGPGGDRKVIINVQAGVSADTFIRSRAEVQRAARG